MAKKVKVQVSQRCEYNGHTGSIFARSVSADERFLFTSGDDGIVARWDLEKESDDGDGVLRVAVSIYALLYIDELDMLVAGTSDGTVYFTEMKTSRIVHTHRNTTDAVYDLYWDAELQRVWILQAKGFISVLDPEGFREEEFVRLSEENVRVLRKHPGTGHFFIGMSDNRIVVLDPSGPKVVRKWEAHDNSVFSLAFHPENKYLLSGGRDAHLKVWDLQKDYALIKSIPAHNFTINNIALSPTGDHFMTASRDKTLKLWDAYTFDLLKVIDQPRNDGHTHSVNKLTWLKADNSVISVGDDRRIIRWELGIDD